MSADSEFLSFIHLPDDIFREVLQRLPQCDVHMLRRVCKSFCSLVDGHIGRMTFARPLPNTSVVPYCSRYQQLLTVEVEDAEYVLGAHAWELLYQLGQLHDLRTVIVTNPRYAHTKLVLPADSVSHLVKGCAQLRTLFLEQFVLANDDTLRDIANHCTNLKHLRICGSYGGQKVTDWGVRHIAQCCRKLVSLELSGNVSRVTNLSLEAIQNNCSRIRSLCLGAMQVNADKIPTLALNLSVSDYAVSNLLQRMNVQRIVLRPGFRYNDLTDVALLGVHNVSEVESLDLLNIPVNGDGLNHVLRSPRLRYAWFGDIRMFDFSIVL